MYFIQPIKQLMTFLTAAIFLRLPVSVNSYDPSTGMAKRCQERCDLNRGLGNREAYTIDCDKVYSTSDGDRQHCRSQCKECPKTVCNPAKENIFNCPATDINGDCKTLCDEKRTYNLVGSYLLSCEYEYKNDQSGIDKCKQTCGKCPDWVCKKTNTNHIYCPTLYTGACKQICENRRKKIYGDKHTDPFQYDCTSQDVTTQERLLCSKHCGKCPKSVCDPLSTGDKLYKCPSDRYYHPTTTSTAAPATTTTTTTTTTPTTTTTTTPTTTTTMTPTTTTTTTPKPYEGSRCEDRCEKFRLSGPYEFNFECEFLFKSVAEQNICKKDCEDCPSHICDPNSYGVRFNCPALAEHEESVKKKAKETYGVIIAVIIAIIMAILTAFALMYYHKYSRVRGRVNPVRALVRAPVRASVKAPVKASVKAPVKAPAAREPPPKAQPSVFKKKSLK